MMMDKIMQMPEIRKIEAQIGFTGGILVGAIAAGFTVLFFAQMAWYFKLFTAIGSIGIIGSLIFSLAAQIQMRRNYLATMEEMKRINTESNRIIKEVKKNGK